MIKDNNLKKFKLFVNKPWKIGVFIMLLGLITNQIIAFSMGTNLLSNGFTKLLNSLGIYTEEISSITIKSNGWDSGTDGAWKIDKTAKWTSSSTVEVTFDVMSLLKQEKYKDVILVLDTSGSMDGEKLDKLKSDTIEFVDVLLENSHNSVSLIQYSSLSNILSDFTDDKKLLIEKINAMEANGNTNYNDALKNVGTLLEKYTNTSDTNLIVLFLTDGLPNIGSPNQKSTYQVLKEKYPFMTINAVQYEMGNVEIDDIKSISDNQFYASLDTLHKVLLEATIATIPFEKFEINDYINNDYFYIDSKEDIIASTGDVELNLENNNQKIYWSLNNSYKIGLEEQLKIKLHLKNEYIDKKDFYHVGNSIEITNKEYGGIENTKVTSLTPVLSNVHNVIYDTNPPKGCNIKQTSTEEYFVYSNVKKRDIKLICSGYIFKGWEIVNEDIESINEDVFVIKGNDVLLRAVWTKQLISKSMDGTIRENATFYNLIKNEAKAGSYAREYTGLDSDLYKYKVYYYRGDFAANNVLFGGFCWKMFRTTDTGGVKMIYNGVPTENDSCNNSGKNSQLAEESQFNLDSNSPAYVGYMYNTVYPIKSKSFTNVKYVLSSYYNMSSYWVADSVDYGNVIEGKYTLVNPYQVSENYDPSSLVGKYTFGLSIENYSNYYVDYIFAVEDSKVYYISLSLGNDLEFYNDVYIVGDSFEKNSDGTYSIINPVMIKRTEWFQKHDELSQKYMCDNSLENICDTIWHIVYSYDSSFSYNIISDDNNYIYAKSFTYNEDTKEYKLIDKISFSDWYDNHTSISNYHYTCYSLNDTCTNIKYIYYTFPHSAYYIELSDGKSVDDALNEMLWDEDVNTTDSVIKKAVENWFENNLIDYEKYLEDSVYCNDRRILRENNGWNSNGGNSKYDLDFYNESTSQRDLTCKNKNDSFTKYTQNGNGKLKYPVGLLTKGEALLVGEEIIKSSSRYWLMSPNSFNYNTAYSNYVTDSGYSDGVYYIEGKNGIRPVISLKPNIEFISGNGTITTPYIVNLDS